MGMEGGVKSFVLFGLKKKKKAIVNTIDKPTVAVGDTAYRKERE